jgi:hypothetical protein
MATAAYEIILCLPQLSRKETADPSIPFVDNAKYVAWTDTTIQHHLLTVIACGLLNRDAVMFNARLTTISRPKTTNWRTVPF